MADNPTASAMDTEENTAQVSITIKSGTEHKIALTLPLITTVGDLKAKLASSEHADVPVERQRLIYSGRILKDHDTLEAIKIKDGNTIHLVKSAASNARQNPANASSPNTSAGTAAAPAVPTMATGTGNSVFSHLTGARNAGFHGLPGTEVFGPDGGMGAPPDPDALLGMMDNPMFVSQMNEMMNNPAVMNMLLDSPHVRNNPQMRMMLQNPEFRRLMLNPDMLRMQLQMQRAMNNGGAGGAFPMPGETDTTTQTGTGQAGQAGGNAHAGQQQQQHQQPPNPFAMFGQPQGGQGNPFAALFNPPSNNAGQTPSTSSPPPTSAGQTTATSPPPSTNSTQAAPSDGTQPNPFANMFGNMQGGGQNDAFSRMTQQMMQNPEMMRAAMNMVGGMMGQGEQQQGAGAGAGTGAGAGQQQQGNPFAGLFNPMMMGNMGGVGGMGASPEPPDNRPPEERYEDQLRQLNDMGFYEFDRNVAALRRSGGSVQGAVEYLLNSS